MTVQLASLPDHFDPTHLRPIASLNRRRFLIAAPDDEQILGKSAHEVLSAQAFAEYLAASPDLALPLDLHPAERIRRLQAYLSEDHPLSRLAHQFVGRYGRRLGYFLASIHGANTLAPGIDEWEVAYLAHWEFAVREVILGGGLGTGVMGQIIAHAAQEVMAQLGKNIELSAARHAYHLPLIGAARSLPLQLQGSVVVADFGHTTAKSAIAHFDKNGTLSSLRPFPPHDIGVLTNGDKTEALAATMKQIVVARYHEAMQRSMVAPYVVYSLAAYLDEQQQPVKIDRGAYTRLHTLAQPLEVSEWLARGISAEVGTAVVVQLMRDTEAAASAYVGVRRTHTVAIVMLGTALGVGFVPEVEYHRPLADNFTVDSNQG